MIGTNALISPPRKRGSCRKWLLDRIYAPTPPERRDGQIYHSCAARMIYTVEKCRCVCYNILQRLFFAENRSRGAFPQGKSRFFLQEGVSRYRNEKTSRIRRREAAGTGGKPNEEL